jgi:hypothetical protein
MSAVRIDAFGGPVVHRRFTWDENGILLVDSLEERGEAHSRLGASFVSRIRPEAAAESGFVGPATWTGSHGAVRLTGVEEERDWLRVVEHGLDQYGCL